MKVAYVIDHESLVYRDSLDDSPGIDPLEAVLTLTELTQREGFSRERFCWWCENYKVGDHGQLREKGGKWIDRYGSPVRAGSASPLAGCGGCVLGALREVDVAEEQATLEVKLSAAKSMLGALYEDPARWEQRIQQQERAVRGLEIAILRKSGRVRTLVQHFSPIVGARHQLTRQKHGYLSEFPPYHAASNPVEESWSDWREWDPEAVGFTSRIQSWELMQRQQEAERRAARSGRKPLVRSARA